MDGGAWWAAVHGVARSRTRLSDFTFTFHFHALEKAMATHSGVLAWRIPGTGEPGGLPSLWSHRVGHDWSVLAAAAALADNFWSYWHTRRLFVWTYFTRSTVFSESKSKTCSIFSPGSYSEEVIVREGETAWSGTRLHRGKSLYSYLEVYLKYTLKTALQTC